MLGKFFNFGAAKNKTAAEKISVLSEQGYNALSKGDYEKALLCWNEVLQLDPKNIEAYINRGNTYAVTRHWDEAISNFNEAIRLDPNYGLAYSNRGNTYSPLMLPILSIGGADRLPGASLRSSKWIWRESN